MGSLITSIATAMPNESPSKSYRRRDSIFYQDEDFAPFRDSEVNNDHTLFTPRISELSLGGRSLGGRSRKSRQEELSKTSIRSRNSKIELRDSKRVSAIT